MLKAIGTRCLLAVASACVATGPLAAQSGPDASGIGRGSATTALSSATAAHPPTAAEALRARAAQSSRPGYLVPDISSALLAGPVFPRPRPARPAGRRASVLLSWSEAPRKLHLSETSSFSKYAEDTGQLRVDYTEGRAAGFSVDASLPLRGRLGLALGGSYLHRARTAQAAAEIPHLFYVSRPRAVTHRVDSGALNETSLRVGALYCLPLGPLRASFFTGVNVSSVEADLVQKLVFKQVYPYEAQNITVVSMPSERVRKLALGPDAGLALDLPLFPHVGIGAIARYSGVSTRLTRPSATVLPNEDANVLAEQIIRPAGGTALKVDTRTLRISIGTRLLF